MVEDKDALDQLVEERELEDFAKRLEWALRARKRTQAWLAEQLNISDQAISKWKSSGMLSRGNLMQVCKLLDVEAGWLMNGWGPGPLARERIARLSRVEDPALASYRAGFIPVVGTAQLGDDGYWAEFEAPAGHGDGYVTFSSRDRNAYAVRCRGDSMKPRIKNGEFVIVEPNREAAPGDEVLVKDTRGRVMVKEFLYKRDGAAHLLSVNEAHGKIIIPLPEIELMHPVAGIARRALWSEES